MLCTLFQSLKRDIVMLSVQFLVGFVYINLLNHFCAQIIASILAFEPFFSMHSFRDFHHTHCIVCTPYIVLFATKNLTKSIIYFVFTHFPRLYLTIICTQDVIFMF